MCFDIFYKPHIIYGHSIIYSQVQEKYLYDFTRNASISGWTEQSDTVRTVGQSKAVMVVHENTEYRRAVFFALLNPQSNGAGFAGVRALGMYYLAGYSKLQIRCRAQGQFNGYKIVLRHKNLNDEPNYSFEQYFQVCALIFCFIISFQS